MHSRLRLAALSPFAFASGVISMILVMRARPYAMAISGSGLPAMLGGEEWDVAGDGPESKGLRKVTLTYGYPHDLGATLIDVTTELGPPTPDGSQSLPRLLSDAVKRDEAIRRGEWLKAFEPSAGELVKPAPTEARSVLVSGREATVKPVSDGHYEAFRFQAGSAIITVVGRHVNVPEFRFESVDNFRPYFLGYFRFVLSWLSPRH